MAKKVKSIALSAKAIKKVGQLAHEQNRSFSKMVEVIILAHPEEPKTKSDE